MTAQCGKCARDGNYWTVTVTDFVMVPLVVFTVAVIEGLPNAMPVTTPVLLTVARVVSLELHAT